MGDTGLTHRLHELSATEIVQAIQAGQTTCEAVARACLERIAEREPAVQAWQYLDPANVLARARALDQRGVSGPLHGAAGHWYPDDRLDHSAGVVLWHLRVPTDLRAFALRWGQRGRGIV